MGMLVLDGPSRNTFKLTFPVVLLSFIHTIPWILVNSSGSDSIERFENLIGSSHWTDSSHSFAHETLAAYYYRENDFEKAIHHYDLAFSYEGNPRYFTNVVKLYSLLNNEEKILEYIPKYPDNPNGYYFLGRTLMAKGRTAEGVSALEKTAELDPEYPGIFGLLGDIYAQIGRTDDAVKAYEKCN